jgi:hypothetical protein
MPLHNKQSQGFALLMALIVVSVVISIGLSVLDLTMKQVRLSTNSKDSEIAFHAANAGLECARYWQAVSTTTMEAGASISPSCFGVSAGSVSGVPVSATDGTAHQYTFEIEWGTSPNQRCSKINMLSIVSDLSAESTVAGMNTLMPGYAYGDTKDCEAGGRCSVLSVQGYSRPCGEIGAQGTVQREVLLEL